MYKYKYLKYKIKYLELKNQLDGGIGNPLKIKYYKIKTEYNNIIKKIIKKSKMYSYKFIYAPFTMFIKKIEDLKKKIDEKEKNNFILEFKKLKQVYLHTLDNLKKEIDKREKNYFILESERLKQNHLHTLDNNVLLKNMYDIINNIEDIFEEIP
jgi:hypothetical protein